MSMLPIQTTIAFRSYHRPALSLRAAVRAEPATASFPDHRTSAQILQATITSRIRATIACRSSARAALLRSQMLVLIKQLSVAAQPLQSRLTAPDQRQAPER